MVKLVTEMGLRESILIRLQQATCDKPELDRRFLRIWKSLEEVEKVISDGGKERRRGR